VLLFIYAYCAEVDEQLALIFQNVWDGAQRKVEVYCCAKVHAAARILFPDKYNVHNKKAMAQVSGDV